MIKKFLSLIKFSHTVFAMPFALTGFFGAASMQPEGVSLRLMGLVVLCMVFARSAAMAFNRWLDRDLDAANPRTRIREIPSGQISPRAALAFTAANCVLFVATTWFINPLCFGLSPVALLVVLGYSYTKRFTWLCHVALGMGLGLAPVGAWIAVTGQFHEAPILYGLAVLCWTAGFDVIYAMQDEQFDRERRLYSIPAQFGGARGLRLSKWLHLGAAAFMAAAGGRLNAWAPHTGGLLWMGTAIFLLMLIWQHRLVRPNDLSRVNIAFFTTNGVASLIFGAFAIVDLLT